MNFTSQPFHEEYTARYLCTANSGTMRWDGLIWRVY